MKRMIIAAAAIAAVVALANLSTPKQGFSVPVVHAQSGCNVAKLTGNYGAIQQAGFTASGQSLRTREVPWQLAGILAFDGEGNVSTSYSGAVNGGVFTNQTSSGTYTVNPDCSGSMSFTSGSAAGYAANLVIVSGGAEFFGVSTGTGDTASFVAKKQ